MIFQLLNYFMPVLKKKLLNYFSPSYFYKENVSLTLTLILLVIGGQLKVQQPYKSTPKNACVSRQPLVLVGLYG